MGKWAEVHCNCSNRIPLANSSSYCEPYRNKRRLTKREKEEREEWERTTKNRYECGHRSGVVIELWPGDIIHLGNLLGSIFRGGDSTFEVFAKVGDWRCYEDELLVIHPEEASFWLLEIDEIRQSLQGFGNLPQDKVEKLLVEFFRAELGSRASLESRLDEAATKIPFAQVVPLRQNVQQAKRPDLESTVEKIIEALADAAKLCRASLETGNPVRLLW
jgi:hypothetical protein